MPDSNKNSNVDKRIDYNPIIDELLRKKYEFSDTLKETLRIVRKSEEL